jgi:hypothetical protein
MGLLLRRAERRELEAKAESQQRAIDGLRQEIADASKNVRRRFEDLPGFPACPSCDGILIHQKVRLRKGWRWRWICNGCGFTTSTYALHRRG